MQQGQTLKFWLVFLILINYVNSFEIFIGERLDGQDQNVEQLGARENKSYEINLFKSRYITIRIDPNDLRRNGNSRGDVVGFKFQIRSSLANVVEIRKVLPIPADQMEKADPVIEEDLFVRKY